MAAKYCPECRHELAGRSRYCQFCGCDLRTAPAVSDSRTSAEKTGGDSERWNPEEAYRSRKSAAVLLVIFLAVAAIAAAFILAGYTGSSSNTPQLGFRAGMGFEEADSLMRQNGFVPEGSPVSNAFSTSQAYKPRDMYGCKPVSSELSVDSGKSGQVTLALYYLDASRSNPAKTETFTQLKKNMSKLYGDPVLYNDDSYYWPAEHGYRLLTVVSGMIVVGDIATD